MKSLNELQQKNDIELLIFTDEMLLRNADSDHLPFPFAEIIADRLYEYRKALAEWKKKLAPETQKDKKRDALIRALGHLHALTEKIDKIDLSVKLPESETEPRASIEPSVRPADVTTPESGSPKQSIPEVSTQAIDIPSQNIFNSDSFWVIDLTDGKSSSDG